MIRRLFPLIVFFLAATLCFGAPNRISLSDFTVHSGEPRYAYLGKGFSEMIAVELGKSPGIALIERKKRNELLEEMEASLADFSDSGTTLELGRLLSARYIVAGELVDMGEKFLVSLRMVEVETGKIVWSDQLVEKLSRYERISGYFASSILSYFDAAANPVTTAKAGTETEKKEDVVVSFSRAVDHYDEKDLAGARKELAKARREDPSNEAVALYLSLTAVSSPRSRVEMEFFSAVYNPAWLGFAETDVQYSWWTIPLKPPGADENGAQIIDTYYFKDYPSSTVVGYSVPFGDRLGVSLEFFGGSYDRHLKTPFNFDIDGTLADEMHNSNGTLGGTFALGYRVADTLGLGAFCRIAESHSQGTSVNNPLDSLMNAVIGAGLAFSAPGGTLSAEALVSWATIPDWYLDADLLAVVEGINPLVLDAAAGYAFANGKATASLRTVWSVYLDDRGGFAVRTVPVLEYRPFKFLVARGGYENSQLLQDGRYTMGHGFLAGITLDVWKLEFNCNMTIRKKPTALVPGYLIYDSKFLMGIVFKTAWVRR